MRTDPQPSPSDEPEGGTSDLSASSQPGPRPATLGTSVGLPGKKRLFFHFEIGIRKTATLPGSGDPQAQRSEREAASAHTKLGPQRPPPPPPPPAPDGGATAPLAPSPLAGAGNGSSTSTSAGYVELSVGVSTETPPYSGGGPVG